MAAVLCADRDQVLAFRLDSHHLTYRRPRSALLEVAGACGVRNTPPGSAALAMHARLADLTPDAVDRALADDRTLVEVLSMRISPHVVPARDVAVFTLGALPATEESLLASLSSLAPALKGAGMPATEALQRAAEVAYGELDGRSLERGTLSAAMTRRLPEILCPWRKGCGTRHVHESLFRLVGVRGVFVIAFRPDKGSVYVCTDQWLGAVPDRNQGTARAALRRRYLSCFGPSTAEHFAAWSGIAPADTRHTWDPIADHLVAVDRDGRRAWLHADDVPRFESPAQTTGVRLLPPYDAHLDQRDRATLLPDVALHRHVWKILGNPGAVLADGQNAGLWRPQKKGKQLAVTVESFTLLSVEVRAEIEAEATLLAPHRGCTTAEVAFAG